MNNNHEERTTGVMLVHFKALLDNLCTRDSVSVNTGKSCNAIKTFYYYAEK